MMVLKPEKISIGEINTDYKSLIYNPVLYINKNRNKRKCHKRNTKLFDFKRNW